MIISKEDLADITQLRDEFNKILLELGSITAKISNTEDQLETIKSQKADSLSAYKFLVDKEREMASKLNEKYGTGTLDLDTGEITPI